jgi:hypothetical protein
MAFNSLILPYNKILEVEECEPISSPSSTSFEDQKTVPYYLHSSLYKTYNFQIHFFHKKNKSSPSSLESNQIFLENTNRENISLNYQEEINTNLNPFQNNIKLENNNKNFISPRPFSQVNDLNSLKLKSKNSFKRAEDLDKKSYLENRYNCNNIINVETGPRINPVDEDSKFDSFMEEMNHEEYNNNIVNNEEEVDTNFLNKRKIPKIEPRINEINYITVSNNRYTNPNLDNKKGIYQKKRIQNSCYFDKKDKNNDNISTFSLKRDSIKTCNLAESKAKNRPLILNLNSKRKINVHIKINQFKKILKNDGLFHLLRFLDYSDINSLYKARNKKLFILINTAITNAYYFNVKEYLLKYNNIIELLKCKIIQSKIRSSLKIDFVLNIRFIHLKNDNMNKNRKIKLTDKCNNFTEPLYFQFRYIYNYFQKGKKKNELITKEEYEKLNNKPKMFDYYTFDLYPEKSENNNLTNKSIYISKELTLFEKDGNNIVSIQPILPFSINDKGIINLELYTANNGFVDPDSIKIIIKSYNIKNHINKLSERNINNPRICDCENLCYHWKDISLYLYHKTIINIVKRLFEPFFEIKKICFENTGIYIFKVYLLAIKSGVIDKKNKFEIKIKIKEKDDYLENEIRKNNLIFERRDMFELNVGDQLLYYFSVK